VRFDAKSCTCEATKLHQKARYKNKNASERQKEAQEVPLRPRNVLISTWKMARRWDDVVRFHAKMGTCEATKLHQKARYKNKNARGRQEEAQEVPLRPRNVLISTWKMTM